MENIRFQALAGTLPRMDWSREEYTALLGEAPDWEQAFIRSVGDETVHWLNSYPTRRDGFYPSSSIGIYLLLDMRHTLARSARIIEAVKMQGLTCSAKRETIKKANASCGFLYADITSTPDDLCYRNFVWIQDCRLMAELAFDIFKTCKNDELPTERPQALDGLCDRLGNRPLGFESGNLDVSMGIQRRGFRIFIDTPEKENGRADEIAVLW